MRDTLTIASRRSRLAQVQAEAVGRSLMMAHPGLSVRFAWVESEGDRRTDVALAELGGKGLFTRGIDARVLAGEADLAVHSLKDVPVREDGSPDGLDPGLRLAAVPVREDPRDCLIARGGEMTLADLPRGVVLATSSPRRAAQVRRLRADLRAVPIRGNVPTRIARVLSPEEPNGPYATLLAAAGLNRLGLREHASSPLSVDDLLPAACQGALGIVCRGDDAGLIKLLDPLDHADSHQAAGAERAVVRSLGADCHSPVAVLASPPGEGGGQRDWTLHARVLPPDGGALVEAWQAGSDLAVMVERITRLLHEGGAVELLRATRDEYPSQTM